MAFGSLATLRICCASEASLMFLSNFSGDKLKGGEDQAASPAGRTNNHGAVSVRPVSPSLRLSENGISATDNLSLHL